MHGIAIAKGVVHAIAARITLSCGFIFLNRRALDHTASNKSLTCKFNLYAWSISIWRPVTGDLSTLSELPPHLLPGCTCRCRMCRSWCLLRSLASFSGAAILSTLHLLSNPFIFYLYPHASQNLQHVSWSARRQHCM